MNRQLRNRLAAAAVALCTYGSLTLSVPQQWPLFAEIFTCILVLQVPLYRKERQAYLRNIAKQAAPASKLPLAEMPPTASPAPRKEEIAALRYRVRVLSDGTQLARETMARQAAKTEADRLDAEIARCERQLHALGADEYATVVPPPEKRLALPPAETAEPREEEYVPAGQDVLDEMLLEYMREQVAEARRTAWTAGRRRQWVMNGEWAAEIRRAGAWEGTYCYGYPVIVSDEYGAPDLRVM